MARIVLTSLNEDLRSVGLPALAEDDTRRRIETELEKAFQKDGVSGMKTVAFQIEAGTGKFASISDAKKWLEGILGDAIRHGRIGSTKMNLSARDEATLSMYRNDLRKASYG